MPVTPSQFLALQRSAGNRAIARIVWAHRPDPSTERGPTERGYEPAPRSGSGATAQSGVPIQRKVGFEFETNMPVRAGDKPVISKDEKIFEASTGDWHITPDASMIEFVTAAFDEEGEAPERGRMEGVVTEMANAFTWLHKNASENFDSRHTVLSETLSSMGRAHPHEGNAVYIPQDARVYPPVASPQATGGVGLATVLALFEAVKSKKLPLNSPTNPEDVALFGDEPEARRSTTPVGGADEARDSRILDDARVCAEKYVSDLQITEISELQGLLALVFAYLLAGERQSQVHDQAKYFLPLMTRMSFTAMYAVLPDEAKEKFQPIKILHIAGLDPDDYVYKKGFIDRGAGDREVSRGPKRKEWLESRSSFAACRSKFPRQSGCPWQSRSSGCSEKSRKRTARPPVDPVAPRCEGSSV